MEYFYLVALPILAVLPAFIFTIWHVRKDINILIKVAKCFNPNVTTRKEARKIVKHNYNLAKQTTPMPIKNVPTMLAVMVVNAPQSIVSLETATDILTPDYFEIFDNYKKSEQGSVKNNPNTTNKTTPNKTQEQTTNNKAGYSVKEYFNLTSSETKQTPSENIEFKYFKNPKAYAQTVFDKNAVCSVCKTTKEFYFETFYDYILCPACLKNGGLKKLADDPTLNFNEKEYLMPTSKVVTNPKYIEEFSFRTPAYESAQDNIWATHCGDFCTYVEPVMWEDIKDLGKDAVKQIENEYKQSKQEIPLNHVKKHLVEDSDLLGHLFQCNHCKEYQLYVELD